MNQDRGRRHRNRSLMQIEEEIAEIKWKRLQGEKNIILWKGRNGIFKANFSSKETMDLMRTPNPIWEPHKGIWFSFSTLKSSLVAWLAAKNRLSTGEKMDHWSINVQKGCSFCNEPRETRDHLFLSCTYSMQIWRLLTEFIMGKRFTDEWEALLKLITKPNYKSTRSFIIRHVFQAAIHTIWSEGNNRRHIEKPKTHGTVVKIIDITIRNRLSTMKGEGKKKYEDGLRTWFATRNL